MQWKDAAQGFAAMGAEARLQVLRVLIRAGAPGLTVSEIQARTDMAPSTLAHHLKFLAAAEVIEQKRQGRSTVTCANFHRLEQLAGFILSECCANAAKGQVQDG